MREKHQTVPRSRPNQLLQVTLLSPNRTNRFGQSMDPQNHPSGLSQRQLNMGIYVKDGHRRSLTRTLRPETPLPPTPLAGDSFQCLCKAYHLIPVRLMRNFSLRSLMPTEAISTLFLLAR